MKKCLFVLSALFCLAACNKMTEAQQDEIYFNIEHPSATKATSTAFEADDAVSLFAVEYNGDNAAPLQKAGNYMNNEKLKYDGSGWKPEHKLYWSSTPCDFYGFYPYQPSFESIEYFPFTVAVDQNNGGFTASDLMFAKATKASRDGGAVNLHFNHMLSKLVVKLVKGEKFEGEIPDDVVAHVYNTTTSCVVDWTKGSAEKNSFGGKSTITMNKISNSEFEAVVVPQNIEKKTPLIEITMGGIAYLLEYSISFRAGYVHTISVTLNTSPDQEMFEINIDPSQGDWN